MSTSYSSKSLHSQSDINDFISELTFTSDDLPLRRILKKIEADVVSISASRTDSGNDTLVGYRSPGKTIASVGRLTAVWAERVRQRARLHKISAHLKEHDSVDYIPPGYYTDLLELQRIGLHPKRIRHRSWNLLLVLLQRRRTERIVDVLSTWPSIETQLFVRQLAVFKLSGWTFHPDTVLESPEKASGTPSNYTQEMDGDSLIHSCRSILSALLRQDPDTLHQSLGVDEYLALQLPSTVGAESEILDPFFSELSDEFCKTASPTWVLPPFGNDFVDFLRTGHLHQVKPVVDYIIHALEPFTDFTVFNPQSDQQRALPLIWFSAHLFLASPLAHDQLLEYGFLDVVERIWFHTVATTAIDDQSTTALQVACCIAIGAFSAMQDHYPDLAHHLRTERTNFFLSIFTHYISNHRAISSVCSVRCRSFPSAKEDRQQFYKELVRLATEMTSDDSRRSEIRSIYINEMKNSRHDQLASALLKLPTDDAQQIVRDLMSLRLAGWEYPSLQSVMPAEGELETPSKSFRNLLRRIFEAKPSILHNSIDIGHYAVSQTNCILNKSQDTVYSLSVFFNNFAPRSSAPYQSCGLTSGADMFVQYLTTSPPCQIEAAVRYILGTLDVLAECWQDRTNEQLGHPEDLPNLSHEDCIHASVPFLAVIAHLAYHSKAVAKLFLDGNLVVPLKSIWEQCSKEATSARTIIARDTVSSHILLILACLGNHQLVTLVSKLRDYQPRSWFINQDLLITNVQLCLALKDHSWIDMSENLQAVVWEATGTESAYTSIVLPPGPPLSGLLCLMGDQDIAEDSRYEAASQILTLCTSIPEEMFFLDISLGCQSKAMVFLIRDYLGCTLGRSKVLKPKLRSHLTKLYTLSASLNNKPLHPVERLVYSLYRSARSMSGRRVWVMGLVMSGFYDLLKDVDAGAFDDLDVPGIQLLGARGQTVGWMKLDFEDLLVDDDS